MARQPLVGIFDSGVGGLTVAAALRTRMPTLALRYLADGACFPYGTRTQEEIRVRSLFLTKRLIEQGCQLVVVACNTATSAAIPVLRARFEIPIVGMEPPLKPALEAGGAGKVVAMVTPATARGRKLERLLQGLPDPHRVTVVPMPGLADLVEEGVLDGPELSSLLGESLGPHLPSASHLVLGCTHYGFLRPLLQDMLRGGKTEIVDAAEPVARRVQHQLEAHGITLDTVEPGPVLASTTGDPVRFAEVLERLKISGGALPSLTVMAKGKTS